MSEQASTLSRVANVSHPLTHLVIGVALGCLIVIVPMLGPMLFVPWMIAAVCLTARNGARGKAFAIQFAVIALIVIAAIYAPGKTEDEILARPLQLPAARIRLGDMDEEHRYERDTTWLPRFVYIETTPATADQVIDFPSQDLTMREFIEAIEGQSTLRHRFRHCGNGYTVLYGGDCNFGLAIR